MMEQLFSLFNRKCEGRMPGPRRKGARQNLRHSADGRGPGGIKRAGPAFA